MTRPIELSRRRMLVKAPRELVFQTITSFGRRYRRDSVGDSSKLVSREGDRLTVEFRTRAGLFTYTTLEEITLHPPDRVTFRHLDGPLHYAFEEFTLTDVDSDTDLCYEGEFIWSRIPIIGWIGAMVYTRPLFERAVARHMAHIRETCEARARRSHLFRRPPS